MPVALKFAFTLLTQLRGVLVVFCDHHLKFGPATRRIVAPMGETFRRAATADRFTGKNGTSLDLIAPVGLDSPRLLVIGTGKEGELKPGDLLKLGGIAMGKVPNAAASATIVAELEPDRLKPSRSPIWRWAPICAPTRSMCTRPSAKTTMKGGRVNSN